MERVGGVPHGAVDDLAQSARAAGLEVVAAHGRFGIMEPELGFDLHASTLAAMRERVVRSGSGAEKQIDDVVSALRAAKAGGYAWVSTVSYLDLALRKPLPPNVRV